MKKYWTELTLLVIIAFLFVSPSPSSARQSSPTVAVTKATVTFSTSAVALPSALITKGTFYCEGAVDSVGGPMRFWSTGAAPTSSVGVEAVAGSGIAITGMDGVRNFLGIRSNATDAKLNIQCYASSRGTEPTPEELDLLWRQLGR